MSKNLYLLLFPLLIAAITSAISYEQKNKSVFSTGRQETPISTYRTKYLTITLYPGWTANADRSEPYTVNIVKDAYVLHIDPLFEPPSGFAGAGERFNEVAGELPSVKAVLAKIEPPVDGAYCADIKKQDVTATLQLNNYYTDASQWSQYFPGTENKCTLPSGGYSAWFGGITSGFALNVFGRPAPPNTLNEYAITVSYSTTDVNSLPRKNDPGLNEVLKEVSTMLKTLELKAVTAGPSLDHY